MYYQYHVVNICMCQMWSQQNPEVDVYWPWCLWKANHHDIIVIDCHHPSFPHQIFWCYILFRQKNSNGNKLKSVYKTCRSNKIIIHRSHCEQGAKTILFVFLVYLFVCLYKNNKVYPGMNMLTVSYVALTRYIIIVA